MKKLFKFITVLTIFALFGAIPASAKTVTVQTASFTAYQMGYYDDNTSHWHIAEEAVFDNTCLEYLCVHNFIEMAPNKNYAAIKSYELESDADFYFEGEISLDLPDYLFEGKSRDTTTINFFVSTSNGKIIYPTDGSDYYTVSLASGTTKVSGGINGMKTGDKVYFVAFTDSEIYAPYLMCPMSVYETEYGGFRGVPVNDTNSYSENQGEFGWEFLFAPIDTLEFGTREVTYDEYANVSADTSSEKAEETEQNDNVVISTGDAKPVPTQKTIDKELNEVKKTVTFVVIVTAVILIAQIFVLQLIRKNKK